MFENGNFGQKKSFPFQKMTFSESNAFQFFNAG